MEQAPEKYSGKDVIPADHDESTDSRHRRGQVFCHESNLWTRDTVNSPLCSSEHFSLRGRSNITNISVSPLQFDSGCNPAQGSITWLQGPAERVGLNATITQ